VNSIPEAPASAAEGIEATSGSDLAVDLLHMYDSQPEGFGHDGLALLAVHKSGGAIKAVMSGIRKITRIEQREQQQQKEEEEEEEEERQQQQRHQQPQQQQQEARPSDCTELTAIAHPIEGGGLEHSQVTPNTGDCLPLY
jgi:hypothetical protein